MYLFKSLFVAVVIGSVLVLGRPLSTESCKFYANGKFYDLAPLANYPLYVEDTFQPTTYRYEISLCGDLSDSCVDESTGKATKGAFYLLENPVYSKSICWANLAKWDRSTMTFSELKSANGISIEFKNGDICKGKPRRVTLNIECTTNIVPNGGSAEQDPNDSCHSVINLGSNVGCSHVGPSPSPAPPGPKPTPTPSPVPPKSSCIFTFPKTGGGNISYDLSSLQNLQIVVNDKKEPQTYQYYASACGDLINSCDDIMTGETTDGAVYQMGSSPTSELCWSVLAKWDRLTMKAAPNLNATNGGLSLYFNNGDSCKGRPRALTMNLSCDKNAIKPQGTGIQDSNDSCHYMIDLRTNIVCI